MGAGLDPNVIAAQVITESAKDILSSGIDKLKEMFNSKKYGFCPDPEMANKILQISRQDLYRRLKECIGDHWSLDIIKVGIYISDLTGDLNRKANYDRIKESVRKRFGTKAVKILHLGDRGVIKNIISHLSQLKMDRNLSEPEVATIFENILQQWEQITFFVKAEDSGKEIQEKIFAFMKQRAPIFFLFAIGSASRNAMLAIAELNNSNAFHDMSYLFDTYSKKSSDDQLCYSWSFDLVTEYTH